ncbi:MAG TPA: thrombospondin type 3 repeat-containing protein [Candidatus Thermoplasmatota archaeon]|nr:thrombospondin type 3 repeat-containing protein [Candidatus Thermoplasmatota archaeon]
MRANVALVLAVLFLSSFAVAPMAAANPSGPGTPFSSSASLSNLPTGCQSSFTDDCYHMRGELNALDSPVIDVLLVVPASPYAERDLRAMHQVVDMYEAGIKYIAQQEGLDWLADGVEFHVTPMVFDPVSGDGGEFTTYPVVDPEIVILRGDPLFVPVGLSAILGIGIDPQATLYPEGNPYHEGPCHGVQNPFDIQEWETLPGFHSHHDGRGGVYKEDCNGAGGNVCFAVNGGLEPLPGVDLFGQNVYDLVAHEFGHCLRLGHVGDAGDHTTHATPFPDIMSYTLQDQRKCVSSLDVEQFAVAMSRYLDVDGDGAVTAADRVYNNDAVGDGTPFQVQRPEDNYYASSTGLPQDCPQPDLGLAPLGAPVDFYPEGGTAPGNPVLAISSPSAGATVASPVTVSGTVDRDGPTTVPLAAQAGGPYSGAPDDAVAITGSASGGSAPYTCAWSGPGVTFADASSCATTVSSPSAGSWTLSLTVTDSASAMATATAALTLTSAPNGDGCVADSDVDAAIVVAPDVMGMYDLTQVCAVHAGTSTVFNIDTYDMADVDYFANNAMSPVVFSIFVDGNDLGWDVYGSGGGWSVWDNNAGAGSTGSASSSATTLTVTLPDSETGAGAAFSVITQVGDGIIGIPAPFVGAVDSAPDSGSAPVASSADAPVDRPTAIHRGFWSGLLGFFGHQQPADLGVPQVPPTATGRVPVLAAHASSPSPGTVTSLVFHAPAGPDTPVGTMGAHKDGLADAGYVASLDASPPQYDNAAIYVGHSGGDTLLPDPFVGQSLPIEAGKALGDGDPATTDVVTVHVCMAETTQTAFVPRTLVRVYVGGELIGQRLENDLAIPYNVPSCHDVDVTIGKAIDDQTPATTNLTIALDDNGNYLIATAQPLRVSVDVDTVLGGPVWEFLYDSASFAAGVTFTLQDGTLPPTNDERVEVYEGTTLLGQQDVTTSGTSPTGGWSIAGLDLGLGEHTLTAKWFAAGMASTGTPLDAAAVTFTVASVIEPDSDGDGVPDGQDAFPDDPAEWADTDGDGVGDNADVFPNDATETADADGDGVGDNSDAFPNDPTETTDSDGDGVGDNGDRCPGGADNVDADGDGIPDACDICPQSGTGCEADVDGDNVPNGADNCDSKPNADQADLDSDGRGDVCDNDRDGDGYSNGRETAHGSDPDDAASTPEGRR